MDSRLSRWCDGLLEAGWLVAILAIPLFFNIHSERVFEPDKLAGIFFCVASYEIINSIVLQ